MILPYTQHLLFLYFKTKGATLILGNDILRARNRNRIFLLKLTEKLSITITSTSTKKTWFHQK